MLIPRYQFVDARIYIRAIFYVPTLYTHASTFCTVDIGESLYEHKSTEEYKYGSDDK